VTGRPGPAADLDRVRAAVRAVDAPDVVIGFSRDGERAVCAGGTGPPPPVPREYRRYEIGSASKTYTGLLLATLVRAGQVSWNDPAHPGRPEVTLLHLATHTGGLPRLPPDFYPQAVPRWYSNPYARYPAARVLNSFVRHRPRHRPGSRWRYSNFGAAVLGHALAAATGTGWEELLDRRVLSPLGLTATGTAPGAGDATGHRRDGRTPVPPLRMGGFQPAGAVLATPHDLLSYLEAHLRPDHRPPDAAPDAAPWFFHMVMARMDAPWRVLRVFGRLSLRRDDLLLAGTDLNTVGEVLLEDASWWLEGFADPPQTAEDAVSAASSLHSFAEATSGMTREIGIRKDGPWGRQLVALRARASAQMDEIHASAIRVLDVVAPDPRRPAPRWRLMTVEDGEAPAARLRALCRFLILARDDAGRAAAAGAHADVLAAIQRRIDLTADSLLEGVRRGQAPRDARKRLSDLAGFLVELDDAEGADLLLRRTAAAGAA
jgi:CubicO group peptidase (beta-lactamase class C family)